MDNSSETKKSSASPEHRSTEHHPIHHSENNPGRTGKKISINFNLKTAIIIACIIIVGTFLFVYKDLFIAATVNGSPISRYAVIRELESKSGKSALENLIIEKLIGDEANNKKIAVNNEEVNAEIKNVEQQIKAKGGTLDQALAAQNMTLDILEKQIVVQKKLEALLADKIQVNTAEVEKYIKDNKIAVPEGKETEYKDQITQQLKQQKLSTEADAFIESLKSKASINYFVNY